MPACCISPIAFHLETGSAELSSRVLANLNHLAVNVITPMLQMISALCFDCAAVGWYPLGGTLAVRWPSWLAWCWPYVVVSVSVTPRLRRASAVRVVDGGAIFTAFVGIDSLGSRYSANEF